MITAIKSSIKATLFKSDYNLSAARLAFMLATEKNQSRGRKSQLKIEIGKHEVYLVSSSLCWRSEA